MENIDELINVMMEFEQGEKSKRPTTEVSLERFWISFVGERCDLYEDKGNRVSLMTLHCAKV